MNMSERLLHIIIADDDSDDQLLAQQAIREIGFEHNITSVYNGYELIDLLTKKEEDGTLHLPDFILLDINMPMLNGFAALAQIRDNPELKNIPVYILSTSHSKGDMTLSRQLGANGFYTKPILFDQLKHILEEIVHFAEVHN